MSARHVSPYSIYIAPIEPEGVNLKRGADALRDVLMYLIISAFFQRQPRWVIFNRYLGSDVDGIDCFIAGF